MSDLKRFSYQDGSRKKGASIYGGLELSVTDESEKTRSYELYAVIHHRGESLNAGHYVATCNINHKWFTFDDEKVIPKDLPAVDDGYIFFF